mmetsp:Transcript_33311/g.55762  ORF Transcript_33311/g.55762 Transcript_33311/m.55762 type:complete len:222 (-) Transcript_33311:158-823(-)
MSMQGLHKHRHRGNFINFDCERSTRSTGKRCSDMSAIRVDGQRAGLGVCTSQRSEVLYHRVRAVRVVHVDASGAGDKQSGAGYGRDGFVDEVRRVMSQCTSSVNLRPRIDVINLHPCRSHHRQMIARRRKYDLHRQVGAQKGLNLHAGLCVPKLRVKCCVDGSNELAVLRERYRFHVGCVGQVVDHVPCLGAVHAGASRVVRGDDLEPIGGEGKGFYWHCP